MPWTTISEDSQITAIHSALLPTEPDGVVLYYGDWAGGIGNGKPTDARRFRLAPNLEDIDRIEDDFGALPTTDCFCGGQAFLADGRLLSAGGTFGSPNEHDGIHFDHYDGERACWIYLPRAKTWVSAWDLNFQPDSDSIGGGRWYPTLVTLGNGDVIALGGHPMADDLYVQDGTVRHNNNTPERYAPGSDTWTLMTVDRTAPDEDITDSYPRFHLMPGGMLFSDTAGRDDPDDPDKPSDTVFDERRRLFDPFAGVWTGDNIGGLDTLPSYYARGSAASSVLLPLLPPNYTPHILVTNSPDPTAFRIEVGNSPTWKATAIREGSAAGRDRANGCATLLPTGQVLVTGGWPGNANAVEVSEATEEPELYTPGIDWDTGAFLDWGDEANDKWETIEDAAPTPRGYHSGALLMPDGQVWHGGSTTKGLPDATEELANRHFELFASEYISDQGRPTITDCPDHIGYGLTFAVSVPDAEQIARIALMRCGSVTHGFNSDQRYVGLTFSVTGDDTLAVNAPPSANIAPPGYYMLFVIDNQERVCERASFIRVSRQKLVISADISTYSIHEVDALGSPSQFNDALFVVFDGFMAHEVTPPSFKLEILGGGGGDMPDVDIILGAPAYEAGANQPDIAQRITYPVSLRFTSLAAFDLIPDDVDFITARFSAKAGVYFHSTNLRLSKKQNPRMSDGDPPWLSVDLRVFKVNPGDNFIAGIAHPSADDGTAGAYGYIQDVLQTFNQQAGNANHPFDALSLNQETSRLELGTNDPNGDPVFNYAVARVRFVAPEDINAVDVRVFFRMWNTGWSALGFDPNGNYRRSGGGGPDATPLLGLQGGEIGNIPCFAEARKADMEEQTDTTNRRTLDGANETEVHGYFGCWLDVNQDVKRFPLAPQTNNGPFDEGDDPDGLKSIQELMRGLHQCLIAEIHYQPDPNLLGDTPSSSDNLGQRNILFDYSDNPGSFAAHIVHHTFEIEPSPISFQQSVLAPNRSGTTAARLHPDELIINWGNLPRDALVTFYMPQIDAREIVRAGAARQAPGNLIATSADTIRCKVTDVGFIPIPGPLDQTIAALMTVQLPPGVPFGKVYKIVVRQVSGRDYKVLGTTEFRIEVRKTQQLLPRLRHDLAVLKHIALSIPPGNRWYPIFQRYLVELGDRVRAVGGNPESVLPNPHGTGGRPDGRSDGDDKDGSTPLWLSGEVAQLHYGCCGDFEGFTLVDCDDVWRFDCVKPCFEAVLLTAVRGKMSATVHVRQGQLVDEAINRSCPLSGRPIRANALARYDGHVVGFCSPEHRDRFAKAIDMFERLSLDRRPSPIKNAPRKMPGHTSDGLIHALQSPSPSAPPTPNRVALNERCPLSGNPISSAALTFFAGNVVGFCSIRHRDEFAAAVNAFAQHRTRAQKRKPATLIVERIDLHL